jgi:hypothetical protein
MLRQRVDRPAYRKGHASPANLAPEISHMAVLS